MAYLDNTGLGTLWSRIKTYIAGLGYTTNTGTITGITMNGASKGTSGVVDLGTVITSHQDISGKANTSDLAAVATSGDYEDLANTPNVPVVSSSEASADLEIADEQGNVLVRFINGQIKVKNFNSANKVTSISASSTDAQFPSAKCVWDLIGDIETILASI